MTKDELVEHGKRLATGLAVIGSIITIGLGMGYLALRYPVVIPSAFFLLLSYVVGGAWRTRP